MLTALESSSRASSCYCLASGGGGLGQLCPDVWFGVYRKTCAPKVPLIILEPSSSAGSKCPELFKAVR
eukprot:5763894-Pyramimonas_sp.AAC.1